MKNIFFIIFIILLGFKAKAQCTLEIKVEGIIGPGVVDHIERAIEKSKKENCESILAVVNTPGGNLESTRIIVEKILNSPIPFLCLIAPQGAHAGSAGAIILQSCHVNGALKATNIGAATPIEGTGQDIAKDLRKKMINDTVSWVQGLASLRKRNQDFAKQMITQAKAISGEEAVRVHALDILAQDTDDFLNQASGREVVINNQQQKVKVGEIMVFPTSSRFYILQLISDPQISYFVFMGSLALLYFEFTHPGMILPGVAGSIGLVLSLISFHRLDVWWGGLALIVLGIIMLILEMLVSSYGALGVGGVIAFILGGIFLFDTTQTAYHLPLYTILPTAITLGSMMLGIGLLALRNRKVRVKTGHEELIGQKLKVLSLDHSKEGWVKYFGERWKIACHEDLNIGDDIEVIGVEGLVLKVKKI